MSEAPLPDAGSALQGPGATFDPEWLSLFYTRATEQFGLSRQSLHRTHEWVITLTLGLTIAVLTSGDQQSSYPNEFGFVAVLASFPLLFRFFVRSCLECAIQHRWIAIRNALDRLFYLKGVDPYSRSLAERHLRETIELYYFQWKSPLSIWAIIWEVLRLAYLWPFILLVSLMGWGAAALTMSPLLAIAGATVILYMSYEVIAFFGYRGFEHVDSVVSLPEIPNPVE